METPEACKKCRLGQCPLHCEHLEARLKAEGKDKENIAQESSPIKMQGTY